MLGSLTIIIAHHMYAMPLSILSNRLCDTIVLFHTPYVDWYSVSLVAQHMLVFVVITN